MEPLPGASRRIARSPPTGNFSLPRPTSRARRGSRADHSPGHMAKARHIGIVAVSAEGAALCYRTMCVEGAALFGTHGHPEITMHAYPLAEYMRHIESDRWDEAGRLLLSSAMKVVAAGAELLVCPDNTLHPALDLVRGAVARSPGCTSPRRSPRWRSPGDASGGSALLGTRSLMEGPDLTPPASPGAGHRPRHPRHPADRERINAVIFDELGLRPASPTASRQVFPGPSSEKLAARGCDAVVLGCTEIPLLVSETDAPLPTLDSTRTLARAALREATSGVAV